jgi:hypothetical protein
VAKRVTGVWELFVTDRDGTRVAQVDPYESAEVFGRVNDVSTWQVVLPSDTPAGQIFLTDSFARLEVALDHAVWRSGPVTSLSREVDIDGDTLTVVGADDVVHLARRNAHPQPLSALPPYSTEAYDDHVGPMSTVLTELVNVNAGPGAVEHRRVPGLTVPTPTPVGPSTTIRARWNNLLTLLRDTARPEGLIFDIVDLEWSVHYPANRGATFSAGLETLAGWKMTTEAATANVVVVAGTGEGTARVIRERKNFKSREQWGVAESFVDRRDTAELDELDKAGDESLASGQKPTTVVFTPLDTDGQQFGRDWSLGDIVTVKAGGLTVIDQIREVHVELDAAGVTVTPSVGAPTGDLALFRSLAGLERRVRQLERI